ncbi:MAG: saccharopine dehydrogenase NADP-binding domain-containing protein [Henriciella sp.]|nr:saccharopine dehydrogenase NADP-binding domain-containing protein [Henriciella sp.]
MATGREFDVIVYGSTGYTGRLVAEYLAKTYGVGGDVKWAMAGRSAEKLAAVRDEIGAPAATPLIVADANDPESLAAMTARAGAIATTVGPYQLYGEPLVAACCETGTDYVDLCGEPAWMHEMIGKYEGKAQASGARIVFSCGFDSIPFDLGVWFLQDHAKTTLGAPLPRIKGRVRKMQGTFSGGTAYSFRATMAAVQKDPSLVAVLTNPFSLTMGFQGPDQPSGMQPIEDTDIGSWSAPFIMASINTKNVHRSNALMAHAYGEDFVYDEMMLTGPGDQGKAAAEAIASMDMLGGDDGPKPGEGPSKEERESGFYDVLFFGTAADGTVLKAGVTGDRDPGYGSTSKMLAEAALTLVLEQTGTPGGIWTPAPAMGAHLIKRLKANAGLTFEIEA